MKHYFDVTVAEARAFLQRKGTIAIIVDMNHYPVISKAPIAKSTLLTLLRTKDPKWNAGCTLEKNTCFFIVGDTGW